MSYERSSFKLCHPQREFETELESFVMLKVFVRNEINTWRANSVENSIFHATLKSHLLSFNTLRAMRRGRVLECFILWAGAFHAALFVLRFLGAATAHLIVDCAQRYGVQSLGRVVLFRGTSSVGAFWTPIWRY